MRASVLVRLAQYLAVADAYARHGQESVTSSQIGRRAGEPGAVVRRDLGAVGATGKSGVGHDPLVLYHVLVDALVPVGLELASAAVDADRRAYLLQESWAIVDRVRSDGRQP